MLCSAESVFTFRLHIRKLSDGEPHAMAAKHVLDVGMKKMDDPKISVTVKLHGPHTGLLVSDTGCGYDCFTVWDWRTGEEKLVSGFPIIRIASYHHLCVAYRGSISLL